MTEVKIDWDWWQIACSSKIKLTEECPCDSCGEDCRYNYYRHADALTILCPLCFLKGREQG